MNAKRGFVPDDDRNFSSASLPALRTASKHICYLINEGYDLKQASTFVGNHFLLSERQRLALMRTVATEAQIADRKGKEVVFPSNGAGLPLSGLPLSSLPLSGGTLWIDGFNTIITLEVLLSRSILFFGMDGTIRDLAALRGTYRIIPETETAARLLFDVLMDMRIGSAVILLDEPVSNSGRLKALFAEIHEEMACPFSLDIRILRDVDRTLYGKELVVTSDSIILDRCLSWVNVTLSCLKRYNEAEQLLKLEPVEPLRLY